MNRYCYVACIKDLSLHDMVYSCLQAGVNHIIDFRDSNSFEDEDDEIKTILIHKNNFNYYRILYTIHGGFATSVTTYKQYKKLEQQTGNIHRFICNLEPNTRLCLISNEPLTNAKCSRSFAELYLEEIYNFTIIKLTYLSDGQLNFVF